MRALYSFLFLMVISSLTAFGSSAADSFKGLDDLGGRTGLLMSRCVIQDESGLIWLGTTKGLYSYDGYELEKHRPVGQIFINTLVAKDNSLFIGFNDGMGIYDLTSGEFRTVDFFAGGAVHSFNISNDDIFVGTSSGLYRYSWKDADNPSRIERLSNQEVFSIGRNNDELWLGTIEGLGYYSISADRFNYIGLHFFDNQNIKVVTYVLPENDSTIWVGTPSSLVRYDKSNGKEEVFPLPVLKTIIHRNEDEYYVGTDDGLYFFDRGTNNLEKIDECVVWHSMKDQSGNIWFATDNGLLVNRKDRGLKALDTGESPDNAVYLGLLRDRQGRVWAWSTYGILRYESDGTGNYKLVRHYSMGEGSGQIPHNRVNTIVEDKRNGTLYIATDGGNLQYNESSGQFDRHEIIDTYNWIYDILIDGDNIWYASFEGLFCMKGNEIEARYTQRDGLSTDDIAQVIKDGSGCIWMRTRDRNVYTLNSKSNELSRFPIEDYASSRYCESILSDIEGNVWLSVQDKLTCVSFDSDSRNIETYDLESFGIPEVYSMSDFLGRIWVCSSQGIYMLDKKSHEVKNLYPGARFVSIQYDFQEDHILLGGSGNISCFPLSKLDNFIKDGSQPVYVTSVIVNGSNKISAEDLRDGSLVLRHDENNISISLSDFTYENEMPSRFRMTMSHRHKIWDESINGNTVFLPNLSPGIYSLSFASGQTGLEKEGLKIKILRPWYESAPMITVYVLTFVAIIMLIIHAFTMKRYLVLEKEQRKVLLEQSQQKEAFFGNIAHEFKTPLSLIIAPLSKLINECPDDENRLILKIAHDNATKLSSLIHNTIDYYKNSGSSGFTLIKSEVEFVEFARTIFSSFKSNFPNHEFIFESIPEKIITEVDIVKMEMVLTNLISNACKYTPEGGSVIMTIEEDNENGRFFLKLSDTGIGIPKDELHLVFQRYFESSRSKAGHYDSTGIGLSLIKEYIESHGGSVSVDSDDIGTTFTLVLPCRTQDSNLPEPVSGDSSSPDMNKPLIVIVDDNPQTCTFLETALKHKYRCISSNNGKSGLKLCKDVIPDLIISDVMMPVMDGMEMCRQLREYMPLSTIPIILLTAKSDRITEEQSIQLNIDTFVPKPFEFSTLAAKIDQLIGNRHRMEHKLRVEMISTPADAGQLSEDEKYLKKVTQLIEEHIDDDTLSVKKLCDLGNFNEKQLYRRTKQLTGMSTVEYIRSIRLKKAAILLQKGNFTVSEVMYSVGFCNASYFSRAFSSEYGKTPSEYLKAYKK